MIVPLGVELSSSVCQKTFNPLQYLPSDPDLFVYKSHVWDCVKGLGEVQVDDTSLQLHIYAICTVIYTFYHFEYTVAFVNNMILYC